MCLTTISDLRLFHRFSWPILGDGKWLLMAMLRRILNETHWSSRALRDELEDPDTNRLTTGIYRQLAGIAELAYVICVVL